MSVTISGSTGITLPDSGALSTSIGDAINITSGYVSGIQLGGTGAANLLEDYEFGTWTPVYISGGGAFGAITMDTSSSTYTKIGNMVYAKSIIRTDNVTLGTATGGLIVSGFPFVNQTGYGTGAVIGYSTGWGGDNPSGGYMASGGSSLTLLYRSTANSTMNAQQVTDLFAGSSANKNYIMLSITYQTNQ